MDDCGCISAFLQYNVHITKSKGDMYMKQFFEGLGAGLRRFLAGRYGTDRLNIAILMTGVVISLLGAFFRRPMVNLMATLAAYGLMIWAICRSLSRNTYARYEENRKFLQFFDRLKDRNHRYFDCPKCRQMVRVPRGKGKIAITCPRCREKFIRKT
jgi:hypothetical protein